MHRFLVVVEPAGDSYSASAPDLPGCCASGSSLDETRRNMQMAIERHLRGLRQEQRPIPTSSSFAVIVEVAASPD
jgi:predicted RNase H-like HicB family nuclease